MRSKDKSLNNKGRIFSGIGDALFYLLLSVIYPAFSYFLQINHFTDGDAFLYWDVIITGLFFVASFLYDFYGRYRDCEEQTECVVNLLFVGVAIFTFLVVLVLSLLALLFYSILQYSKSPSGQITYPYMFVKVGLYIVCFFGLYPTLISVYELVSRINQNRKHKISRVQV